MTLQAYDRGVLAVQRRAFVEAREQLELADSDDRALLHLLAPKLRDLTGTDSQARTMLGVILAFHLDDPAGGAELLAVSVQEGDPVAQRTLGYLVQHGIGAGQDDIRAAELYQAAAEAGDGVAAFNLGVLSGRSPDAVRWLRVAAEAQVTEAYPRLGDRLSERDMDEEALQWYVRGAEAGDKGSMFAAACWYRDGFGGPINLVQALRWYLAMLDVGSGDGIHEAHEIVPRMTVDEIYEAGRLSGRLLEADFFVQGQAPRSAASD